MKYDSLKYKPLQNTSCYLLSNLNELFSKAKLLEFRKVELLNINPYSMIFY